MGKVVIQNLGGKSIDCRGKKERLLDILLQATDWMHACGGKGRCTTCKAIILKGIEKLPERTEAEMRFVNMGRLQPNERLCCQVEIESIDLVLKVPEENKLPHLAYTD
jgi:2Fe-2S ferredoxin